MKTICNWTLLLRVKLLFTAVLTLFVIISKAEYIESENNELKYSSGLTSLFAVDPDSSQTYNFGDTVSFFLDGLDTVYVLYVDTTTTDSLATLERAFTSQDIVISLTNNEFEVNKGLFGFNISDFFRLTHYNPADDPLYSALGIENPIELMVQLAPKNLRYPGGSSSKFRHAFGSMNDINPDNPYSGLKNGGYGIKIEELMDFYEWSDGINDGATLGQIIDDMDNDIQPLGLVHLWWMAPSVRSSFEDYYGEWKEQAHYNPAGFSGIWDEPLYINSFISMIKSIEDNNDGLVVDVIYAINIHSEPASVCKDIIDYLRFSTLNHVYNVHVVGVELGNECYARFFNSTLGFGLFGDQTAFEHYWAYINGADNYDTEFGTTGDFVLANVLPTSMIGSHDYISAFKTDVAFDDIKLGLPAENPFYEPIEDKGPFIIEPDEDQKIVTGPPSYCASWNECLYYRYSETIGGKYKFDAVIPHLYFTSQNSGVPLDNSNWGEIPIGISPDNCLDQSSAPGHQDFINPPYSYTSADPRLQCAFNGIVSGPGFALTGSGSWREFLATRQKIGLLDLAEELHFDHPSNKECWPTEWNIKNNHNYDTDPSSPTYDFDGNAKKTRIDVYANRFVHSYLLQEELLNFIKFNNSIDFPLGFMPYANLQNTLGGTAISLISNSDDQDLVNLGIGFCDPEDGFEPYLARTTYHSMKLMNVIHLNDLSYVKTSHAIYIGNFNRQTTAFISDLPPAGLTRDVYVFFTNIKPGDQTYIIRPGSLSPNPFTGTHAEIHCVDALQLYSGSGKGALYDINDVYDNCEPDGFENQFEILGERDPYIDYSTCPTGIPADAMCVTVPPYSCGYFVFSFSPFARVENEQSIYQMYPNPADENFSISKNDLNIEEENNNYIVSIFTAFGSHVMSTTTRLSDKIDISNLPVGVYLVEIKCDGYIAGYEKLVVMR